MIDENVINLKSLQNAFGSLRYTRWRLTKPCILAGFSFKGGEWVTITAADVRTYYDFETDGWQVELSTSIGKYEQGVTFIRRIDKCRYGPSTTVKALVSHVMNELNLAKEYSYKPEEVPDILAKPEGWGAFG